jgi:AcrR family transcriptional regulator
LSSLSAVKAGANGSAPDLADPSATTRASTTNAKVPGKRGQATRRRLVDCTADLIARTPWRSIRVIDIARAAGTSPATFYQYFENVEQAILVLAEELLDGAGELADLVQGDWSESSSWETARQVVDGFMSYWEENRAVFRVVELATEEGDLRFQGLRVRALNAVTVALAKIITLTRAGIPLDEAGKPVASAGNDPMAVAATIVSMLAHVAAHRYGYEFWGIRTASMSDVEARVLHWAVTGRDVPPGADELHPVSAPRTGAVVGGGAATTTLETVRRRR